MRLLGEDITVLAGHGFDEKGPYLLINDISKAAQYRFSVRSRAFTLKQLPERYCVGRFDLLTHQKSVCPLQVKLLPSEQATAMRLSGSISAEWALGAAVVWKSTSPVAMSSSAHQL